MGIIIEEINTHNFGGLCFYIDYRTGLDKMFLEGLISNYEKFFTFHSVIG